MNLKSSFIGLLVFVSTAMVGQTDFYKALADSALTLTHDEVEYDPAYFSITYPNGDVPKHKGVCTDVVIRTYRKMGIDLQVEVHEDMVSRFEEYPKNWGLKKTDKNIDHRRVPNLMTYFAKYGTTLSNSDKGQNYQPGDIVCWNLGEGITHIGVVSNIRSNDGQRYQIIHNIGSGQVVEDVLFEFRIIGHYRYRGNH